MAGLEIPNTVGDIQYQNYLDHMSRLAEMVQHMAIMIVL